jgi:hypothetical protein
MREEVWAIVRAAVEEAMGPLVARQRELEARVERAEREQEADRAKGARAGAGQSGASKLASIGPLGGPSSIPVAFGPSLAPPAINLAPAAVPRFDTNDKPRERERATASSGASTSSAHPAGPRPSIPATGYGVTVMNAPRASLDLESVGPVDIEGFDGGRRKKRVAAFVVVVMLLVIVGAVTMTVLSHT